MRTVTLPSEEILSRVLGARDEILSAIEDRLGLRATARGADVHIPDDGSGMAEGLTDLIGQFAEMTARGARPSGVEIRYALDMLADGRRPDLIALLDRTICVTNRGKQVRPYTQGQREYVDAIDCNDVVFAIGPAGTGKTYLAVAKAVAALNASIINRIVLVRPVVEAGERLGYLPGDMLEKIEPYIRPLHDAFYDLLPTDRFTRYVEKGIIEIAPLAYMRGRTLSSSFIILDEAQNTTREQMKMFLTRLGLGSKAVVTGDITQVDLPGSKESGLRSIGGILEGIPGIAFCDLTNYDVVRHDIVQKIVAAYESFEKRDKYAGYEGNGGASQTLVS
ncbi:MAG: PhoH family protein [Synergistaceae bacterium]|jgi:phosphate starvation-inducible PhoH-like protein|nr:PhoH family protein [Synergistaceae bacterium]